MTRIIVTTNGKFIYKNMKYLDELRRNIMRDALIGAGTDDENGDYIEIKDVYFEYHENSYR